MLKQLGLLIIVLSLFACSEANVMLISEINQNDANDIVLLLGQNQIDVRKETQKDGSFSLYVNKQDQIKALSILTAKGKPDEKYASLGEVFKKDSFISSPTEEYARLQYALNQEVAAMLSTLNGVTEVKVEVSLPAPSDNLWQTDNVKPSVAVVIKYRQGERIDLYVNRIKNLVSKAVPGVTADQVEVLTVVQNVQNG